MLPADINLGIPARGPQGPQGNNGLTPQIDSNGHWKVGTAVYQ